MTTTSASLSHFFGIAAASVFTAPRPNAATAPAPATEPLMNVRLLTPFFDSSSAISIPPSNVVTSDIEYLRMQCAPTLLLLPDMSVVLADVEMDRAFISA